MQRQVWKENIKVKPSDNKKDKKRKEVYDPLMYPFGAEEMLLRAEFAEIEKNEER